MAGGTVPNGGAGMIELINLSKHFTTLDGPVDALRHINLTVNDGDIY